MEKKSTKKAQSIAEYNSKRQQNVLLEKIYSKVKTVAEGHDGLNRRIESVEGKLDGVDQRLDTMGGKLKEHDKRFDRIEMVLTDTNARVKKLGQKVDTVTADHEQRI